MTSNDPAAPGGSALAGRRVRCRSTPAWRTKPGCTTTCSAAKTITPPTGLPSRRSSRSTPGWPSAREPGVPGARCPLSCRRGGDPPVPGHRHRHPDGWQYSRGCPGVAPESRVVYVDYDRCKSGCAHTSDNRAVVQLYRPIPPVTCRHARGWNGGTIALQQLLRCSVVVHVHGLVISLNSGKRVRIFWSSAFTAPGIDPDTREPRLFHGRGFRCSGCLFALPAD
jgi:hypothetical protein